MMLFMVLVSFCLIFRRHQLGLVGTYAFVFYLGFLMNENIFVTPSGETSWTTYLYAASGIWVISIVLIGLFKQKPEPASNEASNPSSSPST